MMSTSIRYIGATLAVAGLVALTACGSSGSSKGGALPDGIPDKVDASGKTLTVWVMQGDYNQETIDAINKKFTERTGAKVDVQTQQWDGITTKLSTALSTGTPPDVIDIGNTQVAGYSANGALLDVTKYRKDLEQGQSWLAGLSDPATIDNKLYAIPGFAGSRAVIYNKKLWSAAGVTEVPKTWAEFTGALDKVKAANTASDFSSLYLPGQHWYVGAQFVWDRGGELAVSKDGKWSGAMSDAKAQEGLEDFKTFQNTYSAPATRTLNTDTPEQEQIFADGKTSAIVATNGSIGLIQKANPQLTDADLGTFAIPGREGSTQPAMLGGSDWGIASRSANPELALVWTQVATSPEIQKDFVFGSNGWIPNSTDAIEAVQSKLTDTKRGFFDAAKNSRATPAAAGWSKIEGTKALENLFSAVASGSSSSEEAAKTFDSAVNDALK